MNNFDQIIALGMSALLKDEDTKRAVIDYIRVLTDNAKPKEEEWREVYWMQSDEVRLIPGFDRVTMLSNRPCRLLLLAYWSPRQKIGHLRAFFTGESDYHSVNYWPIQYEMIPDVASEVFQADDYTDVIRKAGNWWGEAVNTWHKKTVERSE